jgi:nucleotide-binding universal stress UspA family protein
MNATTRIGAGLADDQYRLLVPVSEDIESTDAERRLRTAAAIVRERDGGLVVCHITAFARQTPLDAVSPDNPTLVEAHEAVSGFVEFATRMDVPAVGHVHLTHAESRSVLDAVEKYDCNGVILAVAADRPQRRRLLSGATVEEVVARADCDVFVEKQATDETPIRRLLLAVSGGPHSEPATKTARALALDSGARVDVVHFLDTDATADERDEGENIVAAAERALTGVDRTLKLEGVANVAETIVARSDEYDVTVLGSPTGGLLSQFVFGTVPDTVNQRSENAVLMAQRDTGSTSVYDRWVAGDPTE